MNFRTKAKEVEATGALERGEFNPTGKPKAIYQYWRKHALTTPPRTENFCHFWRVVAIWAPLAYLRVSVSTLFEKSAAWYSAAGIYIAVALLLALFVSPYALLMLGFPYAFANVVSLIVLAENSWSFAEDDKGFRYFAYATPIGTGIYLFFRGIYHGAKRLPEPSDRVKRFFEYAIIVGIVAGFVVLVITAGMDFGWITLILYSVGFIAGAVALIAAAAGIKWAFEAFGEYLQNKRIDAANEEAAQRQYRRENNLPDPEPAKPGIIGRTLTNIGDFILLVWNVVRVNKWKICPIVKIEDEPVAHNAF